MKRGSVRRSQGEFRDPATEIRANHQGRRSRGTTRPPLWRQGSTPSTRLRDSRTDMAPAIAETAYVDPGAEIDEGVEIGPYCVVGPDVKIGRGTRLIAHVCLLGVVEMGQHNVVSPFTVIGGEPQDVLLPRRPDPGRDRRPQRHPRRRDDQPGDREGRRDHPPGQPQLPDGHRPRRPRLQARRPDHHRQRDHARRPRPRRVARQHQRRGRGPPLRHHRGLQLRRRPVADHPRRPPVHAGRRQPVQGPLHQRRRPEAERRHGRGDRRASTRPTA